MPMSPTEAADALREISQTEQRSASAYGYHQSSPHLIMWGVIWAAEYGGYYYYPRHPIIFSALSLAGIVGSFVIGSRSKGKSKSKPEFQWRYAATFVAVIAFISALFVIMPPTRGTQVAAFFPLLVAFAYTQLGIWTNMLRIAVVGVVIGVLTLLGYFYLQPYYLLWLAGVGGGALILGGLWLRSV